MVYPLLPAKRPFEQSEDQEMAEGVDFDRKLAGPEIPKRESSLPARGWETLLPHPKSARKSRLCVSPSAMPKICTSSRFVGVSWLSGEQKWHVSRSFNGKSYHGGRFTSEIEAAEASDNLVRIHGSWKHKLNFPTEEDKANQLFYIQQQKKKRKMYKHQKYVENKSNNLAIHPTDDEEYVPQLPPKPAKEQVDSKNGHIDDKFEIPQIMFDVKSSSSPQNGPIIPKVNLESKKAGHQWLNCTSFIEFLAAWEAKTKQNEEQEAEILKLRLKNNQKEKELIMEKMKANKLKQEIRKLRQTIRFLQQNNNSHQMGQLLTNHEENL